MSKLVHWTAAAALLISAAPLLAEDIAPPVNQRFAAKDVQETPSFQRHVVPLFGRLGCNGRACHGSFQGRGGFRLSLFGYDFKADHEALLDKDSPRLMAGKPDDSLIVVKPTSDDEHEGGQRYERDSWEHRLISRWIAAGAEYSGQEDPLLELRIEPSEVLFDKAGFQSQLRVIAVWEGGSQEDVTPLCRFQSNDSQIIQIDQDGKLTGNEPGDTHLVVYYDKAVVTVPVMRPVSQLAGANYPAIDAPTQIDQLVVNKLRKLGVVPSEVCDDATFLRRLSLDLTGTLPSAADVQAFLKDKSPDKRARKINQLLKTEAYAAWWTTKLCDFTGNNDQQLNNLTPQRSQASQQWYDWIYSRIARNEPYDKLVEGIVLGKSRREGQSYLQYCEQMSDFYRDGGEFSDFPSMPYYWARRDFRNPPERAISFAYAFLGIRIQCAQCHKHPFDQWSKDDFEQFTGFFAYARAANSGVSPEDRKQYQQIVKKLDTGDKKGGQLRREFPRLLKEGKVIPFPEVAVTPAPKATVKPGARPRGRNNGSRPAKARVLGGDTVQLADYSDARQPLMDWLRDGDNELFAKAFVNRVWASYFNVGIVEPPDDLSLANPPSNGPLLDYLARGFVDNNYDMKWLHREILNSATYQRDWRPNETNQSDSRNFSHSVPRRLPAEVAYDALFVATAADSFADQACSTLDGRAIAIAAVGRRNNSGPGYALQVFGRSTRESNCDCDRAMDPTLLQTVFLQNDRETLTMIERRDGWIGQLARQLGKARPSAANAANRAKSIRFDQLRRRLEAIQKQVAQQKRRLARLDKDTDQKKVAVEQRKLKTLQAQQTRLAQLMKKAPADAKPAKTKADASASSAAGAPQPKELVEQSYLRTLSRLPSDQEMERSLAYIVQSDDPVDGVRDLLWALINTKEFIVNH